MESRKENEKEDECLTNQKRNESQALVVFQFHFSFSLAQLSHFSLGHGVFSITDSAWLSKGNRKEKWPREKRARRVVMKNKFREQVADGLKPTLQRAHLKATLFSRNSFS